MERITYALMNPHTGHFARIFNHDGDEGPGYACELTLDSDHDIFETEDPAFLLDIMNGPKDGRFRSKDALGGLLPATFCVPLSDFVTVAMTRRHESVVEGGDLLPVALTVREVKLAETWVGQPSPERS